MKLNLKRVDISERDEETFVLSIDDEMKKFILKVLCTNEGMMTDNGERYAIKRGLIRTLSTDELKILQILSLKELINTQKTKVLKLGLSAGEFISDSRYLMNKINAYKSEYEVTYTYDK
jgi:hypothetical protein